MELSNALRLAALISVAVFALAVLIYGIVSGFGIDDFIHFGVQNRLTTPYDYEEEIDTLTGLSVSWRSGPVTVQFDGGDTLRVREVAQRALSEGERLALDVSGTEAEIHWDGSLLQLPFVHSESKSLEIYVPKKFADGMEEVEIRNDSGEITLSGLTAESARFETVSGDLHLSNVAAETLKISSVSGSIFAENASGSEETDVSSVSGEIEISGVSTKKLAGKTTSGNVHFLGGARAMELRSVSGEMQLELDTWPAKAKLGSVEGKITVLAPDSPEGFTCKFSSVSGDFKDDFSAQKTGGSYSAGAGASRIEITTTSADARIVRPGSVG